MPEKKVKLTKDEKEALTQITGWEGGMQAVVAAQVREGARLRRAQDAFWIGVRERLGLSVDAMMHSKGDYIILQEEVKE